MPGMTVLPNPWDPIMEGFVKGTASITEAVTKKAKQRKSWEKLSAVFEKFGEDLTLEDQVFYSKIADMASSLDVEDPYDFVMTEGKSLRKAIIDIKKDEVKLEEFKGKAKAKGLDLRVSSKLPKERQAQVAETLYKTKTAEPKGVPEAELKHAMNEIAKGRDPDLVKKRLIKEYPLDATKIESALWRF